MTNAPESWPVRWRRILLSIVPAALASASGLSSCVSSETTPAGYEAARVHLVSELRARGVGDERVLQAIGRVPRHEFVRSADRSRAYDDRALPIEQGQTISQPYVVALMTEAIEVGSGDRILEVGTGSGYQAAVLSLLAAEVYSIEIDAALAESAGARLQALGYANVHVRAGDGFFGWPQAAPFDGIIVTAATPQVPPRLVEQLREGGRLVMPLGGANQQRLVRGRKVGGQIRLKNLADVVFVPMTGEVRKGTPQQ